MKNAWFIAAFLIAALALSPQAHAFSTEQNDARNSDGTPKFADPDEQMPGFMTGAGNANGQSLSLSGGPTVTVPTVGDSSPGARAFDQAYSHQQDK